MTRPLPQQSPGHPHAGTGPCGQAHGTRLENLDTVSPLGSPTRWSRLTAGGPSTWSCAAWLSRCPVPSLAIYPALQSQVCLTSCFLPGSAHRGEGEFWKGRRGREGTDGSSCTQPAASQMGPDSHCTPPSSLHSPGDPGPRSPSSSRLWMLSRAASASGFCHLVAELALYTWPTPLYAELAILPGSLCPSRW